MSKDFRGARCLRRIAHVKIPNTEVLETCHITGIEAFLLSAQLRWTRHVIRMEDTRLPKQCSTVSSSKAHAPTMGSEKDTRTC